ncbi:MAG: hypothetical protein HUJ85_07465, partial [Veillonella sp.]|nr:hypothetical protein [Veillonella sp.]
MNHLKHKLAMVTLAAVSAGFASGVGASAPVSPNVPLNSYVYDYVDALYGQGYINQALPTTKPYSRMQVAKWVDSIDMRGHQPEYIQSMVGQLQKEFQVELDSIHSGQAIHDVAVKNVSMEVAATNSHVRNTVNPTAGYQAFAENRGGYGYENGLNMNTSVAVEGYQGKHLAFAVTPRFDAGGNKGRVSLQAAYAKTSIGNLEIQVGKEDQWWGPMKTGALGLSNNAQARTGVTLTSVEPIKIGGFMRFLGSVKPTMFYSRLSSERQDRQKPDFAGARIEFMPTESFTIGAGMTSIMGGVGHTLSGRDWGKWFTGKNAEDVDGDKWDSVAGYDVSYRFPNFELYGSAYGEDQSTSSLGIPSLSEIAWTAGVYVPAIGNKGDWNVRLEGGKTNQAWYNNWAYTDGYVHKGNIIGDAMGNDSQRIYA